jgi:hypothetical protein
VSGSYDDGTPRWPERDREPPREEPPREEPQREEPQREGPQRDEPAREYPELQEPQPSYPEREEPEPSYPERDYRQRDLPTPEVEAAEPTTSLGDGSGRDPEAPDGGDSDGEGGPDGEGWDPRRHGDRRRPTTAEQAVPWLIGLLLAMTGMVVVLLALIFVGPEGVAIEPTPSPSATIVLPTPTPQPFATATPAPTTGPTSTPPPVFGPLEMVYLGRSTATSPIRLLRRDFTTTAEPAVLAEDNNGVGRYAWAPDGRVGAAIIDGRAVALVEGQELRTLTDPVDALAFADDSSTLYGLRIVRDGTNDRAEVLTIEFESGVTEVITTITYPHSEIFNDPPLQEAQFADNGGIVRLWSTIDGYVVAWILGDPSKTYRIDPEDGTYTEAERQPILWSPDQRRHITISESGGKSTLTVLNRAEEAEASVTVTGLVSHLRWAGTNNEIVFTLGRLVGGGVRQDLYVWDLADGKAPSALTSNSASFGAEWLGVVQSWLP